VLRSPQVTRWHEATDRGCIRLCLEAIRYQG
jgi:hypothetical protein